MQDTRANQPHLCTDFSLKDQQKPKCGNVAPGKRLLRQTAASHSKVLHRCHLHIDLHRKIVEMDGKGVA